MDKQIWITVDSVKRRKSDKKLVLYGHYGEKLLVKVIERSEALVMKAMLETFGPGEVMDERDGWKGRKSKSN